MATVLPSDVPALIRTNGADMWLKLFHLNARSLLPKRDEVWQLLESCGAAFDILMFTETWYTEDSDHFVLPCYDDFHLNRRDSRGGGVSIQTKMSGFRMVAEYCAITADYEILSIQKDSSVFVVLYRPPSGNIPVFLKFLENVLANTNNYALTIGGDLNLDMLKDTSSVVDFTLLLHCHGFQNLIVSPTRVTTSTSSLLDLFITNLTSETTASGVLSSDVSDHLPIFLFVDTRISKQIKKQKKRNIPRNNTPPA